MKFAYTIVYVPNVQEAMGFYETAFGLSPKFIHDSLQYGEMDMETGSTTLAFVSEAMSTMNGVTFEPNRLAKSPAGIELAFTTDDVEASYRQAVSAGATPVAPPAEKPWGQTISYVRDLNGVLVEICSPM